MADQQPMTAEQQSKCPKCGSPVAYRHDHGVKFECGAWVKPDGTESHPLTCHAKAKASEPMTAGQLADRLERQRSHVYVFHGQDLARTFTDCIAALRSQAQQVANLEAWKRDAIALFLLQDAVIDAACGDAGLVGESRCVVALKQIAAKDERIAELERDKVRLDYLELQKSNRHASWDGEIDEPAYWRNPSVSWEIHQGCKDGTYNFPEELDRLTVREAIDKAMKEN